MNVLDALDELLHLPAEERLGRLGEMGLSGEERKRVGRWLELGAGRFMEKPPTVVGEAMGLLGGAAATQPAGLGAMLAGGGGAVAEGPGSRIGRYKLLQLIGEGGFGSVFMAEQEAPVVRKVALKIIKLGMDTKQVIARFQAERQALAMMDHPNIARVLDAGATETGRPYFVMELVKGIAITEYCDKNQLPPRERLGLFVPVCRAVQHAHQKGVIHRDLKPGNVLITLHDGVPVPKVIDFGIAKATNQRLTEQTLFTEFRQFVGTPQYTSPEQAEMSGLDVDTRSDIYSLGVLLYELLTGSTPFDAEELRKAGYAEIQRILREVEPPKPSTRLSTMGQELTEVAARRGVDAGKLGREVSGELDWIVMKCLEKDRTRRYDSAGGLAEDVERFLGNEAVRACPPSTIYRVRKFVRRNKGGAVAVGAVAGALVVGMVGTSIGMIKARTAQTAAIADRDRAKKAQEAETVQKQSAETARRNAENVRKFLVDILGAPDPWAREGQAPRDILSLLNEAAKKLDNGALVRQPEDEYDVRRTLATTYADSGQLKAAEAQLTAALEIARKSMGERSEAFAAVLLDMADVDPYPSGRRRLLRRVLEIIDALPSKNPKFAAEVYARIGDAIEESDGQGEKYLREAVRLAREAKVGSEVLSYCLRRLSYRLRRTQKFDEAAVLCDEAMTLDADHPLRMVEDLNLRASIYGGLENLPMGLECQKKSLDLARRHLPPDDPALVDSMRILGQHLTRGGKGAEAANVLREAIAIEQKRHEPRVWEMTWLCSDLIRAYEVAGDGEQVREWRKKGWEAFCADARESIARKTREIEANPRNGEVFRERGRNFAQVGDLKRSADDFMRAIELQPDEHQNWAQGLPLLLHVGERAEYLRRRSMALQRFGGSIDPQVCEGIAKSSLIIPIEGEDLRIATILADRGAAGEPGNWACFTKGMAEFRNGRYAAAIGWLRQGMHEEEFIDCCGSLLIAMAHHRLGNDADAQVALNAGTWMVRQRLPRPGESDLREMNFHEWIMCHLLMSEAIAEFAGHPEMTRAAENVAAERDDPRNSPQNLRREVAEWTLFLKETPTSVMALSRRGWAYGQLGMFAEAAEDLGRAVELEPQQHVHWHRYMPLLLQIGDLERYRRIRTQALARFKNGDKSESERIAKPALILPPERSELATACAMADRAVGADPGEPWYCFAKGMAEYRSGRFAEALPWLTKSVNHKDRIRDAGGEFFSAMASWRMGKVVDSEAAFARGLSTIDELPKPGAGNFEGNFQDWIMVQFAYREARDLIRPEERGPTESN